MKQLRRNILFLAIAGMVSLVLLVPNLAYAKEKVDIKLAISDLEKTISALKNDNSQSADQAFSNFKNWWQKNRSQILEDSPDASIEINQQISTVAIDLLNEEKGTEEDLQNLIQTFQDYESGLYGGAQKAKHSSMQSYIQNLEATQQALKNHQWNTAKAKITQLQQDWLSVEGDVVSKSQTIYTESEKDLVMMDAYLAKSSTREKALPMLEQMTENLKSLSSSSYGMWDAALIPLREGLEALLVIGALLTFAKKAQSTTTRYWVWGGTTLALLTCIAVGIIVSMILSAAAFGNNNTLINGWSGVIASIMLLYVAYWLHRNSDIKRWNHFIRSKTEKAMSQKRMFSFALLAFLAVLREGMETVIFLIGMVGRMPTSKLITGIVVGFGILVIIGYLMLKIGTKLPLKPFFLISSFIVFYLCFKFMGSGIHSLQMAGVLPSTVSEHLPSVNHLSIFPSWYSTAPQVLFLLIALFTIAKGQWAALIKNKWMKGVSSQR